jgi:hypothetical protein
MIYRVYEPYDDNQPNTNDYDKPDDCFICYELITDTEFCTISLKSQGNYIKLCGCDGWIHKKCLDMWYGTQKKCPICRIRIYERTNTVYAIVPYSTQIYLFTFKLLNRVTTIFSIYLFLIMIEFIITSLWIKNFKRDYRNTYTYHLPYSSSVFNNSELIT